MKGFKHRMLQEAASFRYTLQKRQKSENNNLVAPKATQPYRRDHKNGGGSKLPKEGARKPSSDKVAPSALPKGIGKLREFA